MIWAFDVKGGKGFDATIDLVLYCPGCAKLVYRSISPVHVEMIEEVQESC
jgi:hypothetical protein